MVMENMCWGSIVICIPLSFQSAAERGGEQYWVSWRIAEKVLWQTATVIPSPSVFQSQPIRPTSELMVFMRIRFNNQTFIACSSSSMSVVPLSLTKAINSIIDYVIITSQIRACTPYSCFFVLSFDVQVSRAFRTPWQCHSLKQCKQKWHRK